MALTSAIPKPRSRPAPDGLAASWQRIRHLSHYIPTYDYQPERYAYDETFTTDPHYVVRDVRVLSPSRGHNEALKDIEQVGDDLMPPAGADRHTSRETMITHIPGDMFAILRHTGAVAPDLAVWPWPEPPKSWSSYNFAEMGPPLLALEVVSPSSRDNDWVAKFETYARMGIREYWIRDDEAEPILQGFALDATEDGWPAYRPIAADREGGMYSDVLAASLRGHAGYVQYKSDRHDEWMNRAALRRRHLREEVEKGRVEARVEDLLAVAECCGVLMSPEQRAHYRCQLMRLDYAQLPAVGDFTLLILACPEGRGRTDAALRIWDDALNAASDTNGPLR